MQKVFTRTDTEENDSLSTFVSKKFSEPISQNVFVVQAFVASRISMCSY